MAEAMLASPTPFLGKRSIMMEDSQEAPRPFDPASNTTKRVKFRAAIHPQRNTSFNGFSTAVAINAQSSIHAVDENQQNQRLPHRRLSSLSDCSSYSSSSSAAEGTSSQHHVELGAQNQLQQAERYYESRLMSMRAEFQLADDRKAQELARLTHINQELQAENEKHSLEKAGLAHENKILKKAVQIQDQRNKELSAQQHITQEKQQQLQAILAQAAAHIQMLEHSNRQMNEQLNIINGGRRPGCDFSHQRPPDVC